MQENTVPAMHAQTDIDQNQRMIRRMLVVLGMVALVAAALAAGSLLWRDATHMNNPNETGSQVITIAITILFGSAIIFLWGMKVSPLLYYRKYLKEISGGLSRTMEGETVAVEMDTTFRDGLSFYGIVINVGDINDPEDERRLYWDGQKGQPDIAVGDRVRVRAHGNDIIGLQRL